MKALVYLGPETVKVEEKEKPEIKDGEIRVKVTYCGTCGSDIGIYKGVHPRAKAPLILGHEFVGIIDACGENSRFKLGDRVVAYPLISCGECYACLNGIPHVCESLKLLGIDLDGAMAEYAVCSEDVAFKIDDEVSDKVASLIEPLAVVIRTMHRANVLVGDKLVVMGAGPIGILTAIIARKSGASKIIVADIDENRLEFAKSLGFDALNSSSEDYKEYILENTDGYGADKVFECTGSEAVARDMTDICRIDGTICMTATHHGNPGVNLQAINFKEQTILGSRVYTLREFGMAVEMAKSLEKDLEKVVTHVVPLKESEKIFDMIKDKSINTVKVVVDCRI